ncbi:MULTISPECIES: WhiB family transcriptional regulator [unclassified Streptomyces]|uniref:WhiB family transcriptional regulator n=1 Tax=unclassified Streptomyces TaxID=2593676 RepID=UPI001CD43A02|nr:WhiB family transcriptional regulator [Streptomyces sp. CoH27]
MDNWRDHAVCRHVDPDLFFPVGTTGPALVQTERAKAVCGLCPAREPCLDWALATGQGTGIWGGTTETERRALRRRTPSRPRLR